VCAFITFFSNEVQRNYTLEAVSVLTSEAVVAEFLLYYGTVKSNC